MKKAKLYMFLVIMAVCAAGAFYAMAEEATPDEQKLETTSESLEKDATDPAGQQKVADRIKTEFKVDDAMVNNLRDKGLGYGGISILLALAQKMPEGINDANVQKILAMRQGPPVMGWGKIAKELGLKLGPVVSRVHKVEKALRRHERLEHRKKEKMEKGERPEHPMKMERPNKPERPEKPGKK